MIADGVSLLGGGGVYSSFDRCEIVHKFAEERLHNPVEGRRLAIYGPRAFFGHFAVAEQQLTCFLYGLPLFVLCALLGVDNSYSSPHRGMVPSFV